MSHPLGKHLYADFKSRTMASKTGEPASGWSSPSLYQPQEWYAVSRRVVGSHKQGARSSARLCSKASCSARA